MKSKHHFALILSFALLLPSSLFADRNRERPIWGPAGVADAGNHAIGVNANIMRAAATPPVGGLGGLRGPVHQRRAQLVRHRGIEHTRAQVAENVKREFKAANGPELKEGEDFTVTVRNGRVDVMFTSDKEKRLPVYAINYQNKTLVGETTVKGNFKVSGNVVMAADRGLFMELHMTGQSIEANAVNLKDLSKANPDFAPASLPADRALTIKAFVHRGHVELRINGQPPDRTIAGFGGGAAPAPNAPVIAHADAASEPVQPAEKSPASEKTGLSATLTKTDSEVQITLPPGFLEPGNHAFTLSLIDDTGKNVSSMLIQTSNTGSDKATVLNLPLTGDFGAALAKNPSAVIIAKGSDASFQIQRMSNNENKLKLTKIDNKTADALVSYANPVALSATVRGSGAAPTVPLLTAASYDVYRKKLRDDPTLGADIAKASKNIDPSKLGGVSVSAHVVAGVKNGAAFPGIMAFQNIALNIENADGFSIPVIVTLKNGEKFSTRAAKSNFGLDIPIPKDKQHTLKPEHVQSVAFVNRTLTIDFHSVPPSTVAHR